MAINKDEAEEAKVSEAKIKAYRERLTYLKKAQEYSKRNDVPHSVENYAHYLNVLAAYFKISEEKLTPEMFNAQSDITELLLISHAYWDLAKAYDRSPRLLSESVRCLDQFVKFTKGNKFQYVNAQMCKKFIKKKHAHHPKNFQNAYKKLYIKGKACFIATYCFGQDDPITEFYRSMRESICDYKAGLLFIELYYNNSPKVVNFFYKHTLSYFSNRYRRCINIIHEI